MTLEEITSRLGRKYRAFKEAEKAKNEAKEAFFREATEVLSRETQAQILELIEAKDREEAKEVAHKQFPRYTLLDVKEESSGLYRILLEELPNMRSFSFENDGFIYQRQVTEGSLMIDDERLKEENPQLWEEITVPTRELKPPETLTPEQIAEVRKFFYRGKPSVKLAAPRKVKSHEEKE